MIPYSCQHISETDIEAVVEVLRSDLITQGPKVPEFELAMAERCKARHAVAVSSGTAALHLACLALGLKASDWFWTVPNTFVATANVARQCGAQVDFVDIDPATGNLSLKALKKKLKQAQREKRLPKVIAPVHFAGLPCDMPALHKLACEFGFQILEDAAHALGASIGDEPIGNCRWSDITVFSFHPVKMITTGEGGMVLCNDSEFYRFMMLARSHGICRDSSEWQNDSTGPWYYEQQILGYNYRMTDIQAALGLSQSTRLDEIIKRRCALAERYSSLLSGMPLQLPYVSQEISSSWHLYVINLLNGTPQIHRELFAALRNAGIGVQLHYQPVHLQPYYAKSGFSSGDYPKAEKHSQSALSLPLYSQLTAIEQDRVIHEIQKVLE